MNLAACSPYVSWKEEVKLNDGRVIVVKQKRLAEGEVPREEWLTIPLPEFDVNPIVWHEHLIPLILNIDHRILYIVGIPPTGREIRLYGCPEHGAVGFKWQNGQWIRIPFGDIPLNIYSTNMLINNFPPKGTSLLTILEKSSRSLNGDGRASGNWTLNPNRGNGC
ncbi:MAG TPA: hypothetical protein VHW71_04290 [Steroidobacteraceae bacterium]|nr:hypothetical protein [Steroidobacteraceae bacterium]